MKDVKPKNQHSNILISLLMVVAAVLLLLAQSAYWLNHNIFDKNTFTQTTQSVLFKESSRNAIANTIVDKALAKKPLIRRLVGDRAVSFVSSLLGTDIGNQTMSYVVNSSYEYATTSNRKDVAIDLTSIKTPLSGVVSFAENRGSNIKFDPSNIPDQVVLLSSNNFPDYSGSQRAILILAPLLWLGSIAGFAVYVYVDKKKYVKHFYHAGVAIISVSLLGLFIGPFTPPIVASLLNNTELRVIAQDLTIAFLNPFQIQMYVTITVASIVLIIFSQRVRIMMFINKIAQKISKPGK